MKKNKPTTPASRPDGLLDLTQPGNPNGPQGPFGIPGEGKPLRTPEAAKPGKATRSRVIHIRLTTDELNRLVIPLPVKGGTRRGLSRLVRSRLFPNHRQECSTYDCRQCRLLAAIVNNLNLVA